MRIPLIFLSCIIAISLLVDWRLYAVIRHRLSQSWARVHLLLAAFLYAMLIVAVCLPRRSGDETTLTTITWMIFAYGSAFTGKALFIIIDLAACTPCLFHRRRLRLLSIAGIIFGAMLFAGMWWGALFNRYRLQINEVEISSPYIPQSFDGYRIAQFSDLHTGTYGTDTTFVSKLVETINGCRPDAIVFTGDLVNRHTDEVMPHVLTLSRLHAPDGVYSILGNHDYGDYMAWQSPAAKIADHKLMIDTHRRMGWKLLLDSTAYIHAGGDSIALVGVENVGDPPFPTYGSLDRALRYAGTNDYKILLSHNPTHWEQDILDSPDIDPRLELTLSGHTHAMQIELLGISPAALRYKRWGGLYPDSLGRQLYVNIGIGTVALPMRLGATPEITVFTLRHRP